MLGTEFSPGDSVILKFRYGNRYDNNIFIL